MTGWRGYEKLLNSMGKKRTNTAHFKCLMLFVFVVFVLLFKATLSEARIVISEIMVNPSGNENVCEYVELFNCSHSETVDLEGFSIGDGDLWDEFVDAGEGFLLLPRSYALVVDPDWLVEGGCFPEPPENALILTITSKALGNRGFSNSRPERVSLVSQAGDTLSAFTYTEGTAPGLSWEKIVLDNGDNVENWSLSKTEGGTPGRLNSVTAVGINSIYDENTLIITEVGYDPPPGIGEWIEILNLNSSGINLVGWTLEDADSTKRILINGSSVFIQPGEYLVVAEDSSAAEYYNLTEGFVIPPEKFISLNNKGDTIRLRDPEGKVIDYMSYESRSQPAEDVSLERVSTDTDSPYFNKWEFSADPSGATPGRQNSITFSDFEKAALDFDQNPFRDMTTIFFKIPSATCRVNLWIYNREGSLVRKLLHGEYSGSQGSVKWDGRTSDGKVVPIGIYPVFIEAVDDEKGRVFRVKKALVKAGDL